MIKYTTGLVLCVLAFAGCDEIETPYNEFEDLEKGAFPRVVDRPAGTFNRFDPANSNVTFSVEFYDEDNGKNVESFSWEASYQQEIPRRLDITPSYNVIDSTPIVEGGVTIGFTYDTTRIRPDTVVVTDKFNRKYGPVTVASQTASQWTPNADGLPQASFTFNFAEVLRQLGIPADSLDRGQTVQFRGTLTKTNGKVFTFTNTDLQLIGQPTFGALFQILQPVVCPSTLAGTYTAVSTGTTTNACCPGTTTATAQVTLTAKPNNQYDISDWSGGLYLAWYGPTGANRGITQEKIDKNNQLRATVTDNCNEFILPRFNNAPVGVSAIGEGTVNGNVITYTFRNAFGDRGTVTLTKN